MSAGKSEVSRGQVEDSGVNPCGVCKKLVAILSYA